MRSRYKYLVLNKLLIGLFSVAIITLYGLIVSLWGFDGLFLPDAEQTIIHVRSGSAPVIYEREYLYRIWLYGVGWLNLTPVLLVSLQIILSATILLFARPSIPLIGIIAFLLSFAFFSGTHNQFRAFLATTLLFVIAHQRPSRYLIATLIGLLVHLKIGAFFGILAIAKLTLRHGFFSTSLSAAGLYFIAVYQQDFLHSVLLEVGLSEIIISYSDGNSAVPYPKIAVAALIYFLTKDRTGFTSSPLSPTTTIPLLLLVSYLGGTGISERLAMALIVYYSLVFCSQIHSFRKDVAQIGIFVLLNICLIFTSQLWVKI
jgi:hypothetical protein